MSVAEDWKPGLPPGKLYDAMVDDYEVEFTVGGRKWHRRRSPEQAAAHRALRTAAEAERGRADAMMAQRALGEREGEK